MNKRFEIFATSADIGIIAYGKTLKTAFANSAVGMLSLLCNNKKIKINKTVEIKIKGEDLHSLLVRFLNEILYYYEVKNVIFKKFKITYFNKYNLKCLAEGQDKSPDIEIFREIKSATYHNLEIEKNTKYNQWKIKILFDV